MIQFFKKSIQAARRYNTLQFFPLRFTLTGYQTDYFSGDLRAGINVALLAFPQGMAYALIAGLPIQFGIYGSAVACIIAPIFSKSRFITLGPTNATAVMLFSTFASMGITGIDKVAYVPLLILLTGCFIAMGAYFRVANLVQYISRSVITGYITAAALLIIANQIPKALGLEMEVKSATFFESIRLMVDSFDSIHWLTVLVSVITALVYLLLNWRLRILPNVAISLVIVSTLDAFLIGPESQTGIQHLSAIDASTWAIGLPNISSEYFRMLVSPALAIALLCVLEGLSIGKSLAAKTGARLDANQAMFSIGMSNIACAFCSGMPASGSLTRSTLSEASKGRTPVASLISGALVLIGAFLIGPLTLYIPQCVLAVLVITIGIALINTKAIRIVTHATRSDAIVFTVTFLSGLLLPLDTAIYSGVAISIMLFLKKAARPEMVEYTFNDNGQLAEMANPQERNTPEVSIVHVEGELFFGAADLFRDQMRRICEDPNLKIVILKMRNAHHMDASGVMALEELVHYMNEMGRYLILSEVKADLIRVLKNARLHQYLESRNIFEDDPHNPTLSTAKALKRAKEQLGHDEANVSIYIDSVRDQMKQGKRD
ncbi:MAG: putative sulfate transporter [Opitutia bacterium UBA7350]|nr:MAG: putative sulfate transporter [Opitutae bacterium UBA7350]